MGGGKTWTGIRWAIQKAQEKGGATVIVVCEPDESGDAEHSYHKYWYLSRLEQQLIEDKIEYYISQANFEVLLQNKSKIKVYSAERIEQLDSPNARAGWIDRPELVEAVIYERLRERLAYHQAPLLLTPGLGEYPEWLRDIRRVYLNEPSNIDWFMAPSHMVERQ